MNLLILLLLGTTLFLAGYHFGNTMGRTQFIREYLKETRRQR